MVAMVPSHLSVTRGVTRGVSWFRPISALLEVCHGPSHFSVTRGLSWFRPVPRLLWSCLIDLLNFDSPNPLRNSRCHVLQTHCTNIAIRRPFVPTKPVWGVADISLRRLALFVFQIAKTPLRVDKVGRHLSVLLRWGVGCRLLNIANPPSSYK
jgi:hypothetical protein